jgi:hypothetical protein
VRQHEEPVIPPAAAVTGVRQEKNSHKQATVLGNGRASESGMRRSGGDACGARQPPSEHRTRHGLRGRLPNPYSSASGPTYSDPVATVVGNGRASEPVMRRYGGDASGARRPPSKHRTRHGLRGRLPNPYSSASGPTYSDLVASAPRAAYDSYLAKLKAKDPMTYESIKIAERARKGI